MTKPQILGAALVAALTTAATPAQAPKPTPELLAKGKSNFAIYCSSCHGPEGHGDGPAGKVLQPPPRNFSTDPFKQGDTVEKIFATLTAGVPGTPMVAWPMLPEEDRWGLAYHVQSLRGAKAPKK